MFQISHYPCADSSSKLANAHHRPSGLARMKTTSDMHTAIWTSVLTSFTTSALPRHNNVLYNVPYSSLQSSCQISSQLPQCRGHDSCIDNWVMSHSSEFQIVISGTHTSRNCVLRHLKEGYLSPLLLPVYLLQVGLSTSGHVDAIYKCLQKHVRCLRGSHFA